MAVMDLLFGLPVHPLVVHLPVVLLPLAAIGVLVLTIKPALRAKLAVATLVVLVVGFLGTLVASSSGEALAVRVGGQPQPHAQAGGLLPWAAAIFLAVGGGWLWWVRRDETTESRKTLGGMVSSLIGVGVFALTVFVGHTGATAAWEDVVNPSAESSKPGGITMLQVSEHDSREDCWVAIDGEVYDLTKWVPNHPGGPSRVARLCGTDATDMFANQHGDAERPNKVLEEYHLGPLGG